MKCVVGQVWGAGRQSLMGIYYALIRSVLDYWCIVYGFALKSLNNKQDIIQTRTLRCITGAINTTPVAVLQVELAEMALNIRCQKLSMAYCINLKGHNEHLTNKKRVGKPFI